MTRDWVRWHDDYDKAGSSLARRLVVVQDYLERALDDGAGDRRLISLCAGDGRAELPILARRPRVRAVLVELDPELARRARATGVDVRTGDAGSIALYADAIPAHVVMLCGVFGNIGDDDVRRTIAALPSLLVAGGIVIWTRGRGDSGPDPADGIRARLADHGFAELAFTRPGDARFRVGMHRLVADPAPLTEKRLFSGRWR